MRNVKYLSVGAVGILLIVLSAYVVSKIGNNSEPETLQKQDIAPATTQTKATNTAPQPAKATSKPKPASVPKVTAPKSASDAYLSALNTYKKSGFYIQFFPCQASPGTLTVKKGAKVMLDNRDAKSHVIAIGATKYSLAAYNYAIATFNTLGINYVTCDGGGSAAVTVQP